MKSSQAPGLRDTMIRNATSPSKLIAEGQPHLMPLDISMRGFADALIHEAKARVVVHQAVLAGQDKTLSSLLPGVLDGAA